MTYVHKERRFCLEIRPYGNFCPHHCSFCYQDKRHQDIQKMDINLAVQVAKWVLDYIILRSISDVKLVFHGGEPACDGGEHLCLLHDELHGLFESANINVKSVCHTSGFSPLDVDELSKRRVQVCLNRHVPGNSSDLRLIFEHNLEMLFNAKLINKQIIAITKKTLGHVDDCLAAINQFNLPTKLQPIFPSFPDVRNKSILPSLEELIDFLADLLQLAAEKKIRLKNVEFVNSLLYQSHSEAMTFVGCRQNDECAFDSKYVKSIAVDCDGTIYPCNRFAGIRTFPFAGFKDYGRSLFNKIHVIRDKIKSEFNYRTQLGGNICGKCSLWRDKTCGARGGCPFFGYVWNLKYDPYCIIDDFMHKILNN